MAYTFVEATFRAAVLTRITKELGDISNTITQEAVKQCCIGLLEILADELVLIDAEYM